MALFLIATTMMMIKKIKKIKLNVSFKRDHLAKSILLFFCALFCSISYADIQGKWNIDADLTIEFNDAHSNMSDLEKELLRCFSANSSLKICGDHFFFSTKQHSCSFGDSEAEIDGFETNYKYEKIFENNDVFVFLNTDEEHSQFVEVIHRVNHNILWVYYSGERPEHGSHVRYYYKRVANCE